MHPEDIEGPENATEGEQKVFRFLHEVTRPDKEFVGWYEPAIGEQGREPDFVLFGKQHGLLVLEVKDWLIDQIGEADAYHFKVWMEGRKYGIGHKISDTEMAPINISPEKLHGEWFKGFNLNAFHLIP